MNFFDAAPTTPGSNASAFSSNPGSPISQQNFQTNIGQTQQQFGAFPHVSCYEIIDLGDENSE